MLEIPTHHPAEPALLHSRKASLNDPEGSSEVDVDISRPFLGRHRVCGCEGVDDTSHRHADVYVRNGAGGIESADRSATTFAGPTTSMVRTCTPSARSRSQIAEPMPPLAPVTNASRVIDPHIRGTRLMFPVVVALDRTMPSQSRLPAAPRA
jgi:hypothetical protein